MTLTDRENSRELIVFYKETGKNIRPEEFDVLVEYVCQSTAKLIYYNVYEKIAHFFINHRRTLAPIIQYLDSQRGLGFRHKTVKPSQKKLNNILAFLKEEKTKDEEDTQNLNTNVNNVNEVEKQ